MPFNIDVPDSGTFGLPSNSPSNSKAARRIREAQARKRNRNFRMTNELPIFNNSQNRQGNQRQQQQGNAAQARERQLRRVIDQLQQRPQAGTIQAGANAVSGIGQQLNQAAGYSSLLNSQNQQRNNALNLGLYQSDNNLRGILGQAALQYETPEAGKDKRLPLILAAFSGFLNGNNQGGGQPLRGFQSTSGQSAIMPGGGYGGHLQGNTPPGSRKIYPGPRPLPVLNSRR